MNPTIAASLFLSVMLFAVISPRAAENPTDDEIRAILGERIDTAKKGVGMVAGIIDEKGTRTVSYGWTDRDKSRAVDGDTVFEIGSVTKVFTSLVLADMVQHGEVKLDDPISKYLPKSVKVPTRNGKEITLVDLATHTSGLPRLPDNLSPKDERNPYADYTVEQMYDFLSRCTLTRDIGEKYEYSNFGVGLLGHILALKAGTNYEALVVQRVCRPLGMTNTMITLTPELKARLATGHNELGKPVENWDLGALAGAGALRSTANDMLKLAAANAGLVNTDLSTAMELEQTPRHDAGSPTLKIGLGWHISTKYDAELIWHNGGTGGYHSFVGFDKKSKRCVVVLANSANSIDDIGCHLLNARYELQHFEPSKAHVAIQLDSKILDRYVGRYQLAPSAFFNVRRAEDRLQAQLTGQSYFDLFPESRTNFFYDVVDAQITFNTNAEGLATNLVLHQNGRDMPAPKISDEPEKERVAVKIDPKIYDAYAGQYELAPGAVFTVRRDGDRLLAQLTGQTFLEVFPESETNFFYKVVDARLTFVKNDKGEVTELILHQNGDQIAKRMK
jgi:D-alanyl-D-alanine-carboxypeptidase/D-alanyl-D-alanine-endopeptidase